MKLKTMVWSTAALVALAASAQAQIVPGAVALPDSLTANRTLSADSVYQMVNTVKVGPGVTLTIQPGTIIYGNKNGVRSCLQIERDGKIYAQGTPTAPIIFTSAQPQGSKALGDWGGIIILGKARTNNPGGTQTIEGGTNGIFGGTDDADSSGVLSYVRIEYAGIAFSPNNEINGLTLGGVGNRTKLDHIQVSYANDDSYEFFGGAVNAHHLIAWSGIDDDFDTDNGFRGRLQFLFSLRDSSIHDISTSNGMEADNDATGSLNTPISNPVISNLTLVGPFSDTAQQATANPQWGRAGQWRRSTRYGLYNSVLTGFNTGLLVDGANGDLDSIFVIGSACPQPANFRVRNTVITAKASEVRPTGGVLQTQVDNWFDCSGMGNVRGGNHAGAGIIAVTQADIHNPDPRPNVGSPVATGTDFTDAQLAAGNNFSFTATGYKGAFDPSTSRSAQWDAGWSNYNPHITTYVKHRSGWNLIALANTPASTSKDVIYANAASNAFKYSSGYVVENNLVAGRGYFLKLNDNRTIEQVGAAVSLPQTVSVQAGWNLVSTGASTSAPVSGVTAGGTTIQSSFFGFNNGYVTATTLEPGKAYWVKVSAAGTLTFN